MNQTTANVTALNATYFVYKKIQTDLQHFLWVEHSPALFAVTWWCWTKWNTQGVMTLAFYSLSKTDVSVFVKDFPSQAEWFTFSLSLYLSLFLSLWVIFNLNVISNVIQTYSQSLNLSFVKKYNKKDFFDITILKPLYSLSLSHRNTHTITQFK